MDEIAAEGFESPSEHASPQCVESASPTDAQRRVADDIGKRLFGMNAAAIKARYGILPQRPAFKFAGWADATPVEQFKAIRCLL
jgi:hypothetical protein